MQMQRINITLPTQIIKQLQANIPLGKRSKFIAQAVSEKLGKKRDIKKELEKSLKANRKLDEMVLHDWSITETEGWPE